MAPEQRAGRKADLGVDVSDEVCRTLQRFLAKAPEARPRPLTPAMEALRLVR